MDTQDAGGRVLARFETARHTRHDDADRGGIAAECGRDVGHAVSKAPHQDEAEGGPGAGDGMTAVGALQRAEIEREPA